MLSQNILKFKSKWICHNLDSMDLSNERLENMYDVFHCGPSSKVHNTAAVSKMCF